MIELRWVEREIPVSGSGVSRVVRALQYRERIEVEAGDGGRTFRLTEWRDVPTVKEP